MSIRTDPGSPAWAVLSALARYSPGATAEVLARAEMPWEARPYRNAKERAAEHARKAEHATRIRLRTVEISRLLGRLTEAGLVERTRGVMLDPLFRAAWDREGAAALQDRVHQTEMRAGERMIVGVRIVDPPARVLALVEALLDGPLTQRALAGKTDGLTPSGSLKGAWQDVYWDMVEKSILLSPQTRCVSLKGRAHLAAGALAAGALAAADSTAADSTAE